ncbi:predicted protein, partial [Nematostella vectensis]
MSCPYAGDSDSSTAVTDEKDTRLNYSDYLKLDQLLSCQELQSEVVGGPASKAHDELLFIVTHQAYELWFKEIIHEIDTVRSMFMEEDFNESKTLFVISCLHRVVAILKLLKDQILLLETMTPLGFMEFRNYLAPASGFQSQQFRLIENKLGVRRASRFCLANQEYSKQLREKDVEQVEQAESEDSLQELVQRWLCRTPGLETDGFNFWGKYKRSVHAWMVDLKAEAENAPSKALKSERLKTLKGTVETFETIFSEERHNQLVARGERKFSHKALQGALMISFYRDEPRFNQPYQILNLLMDIDSLLIKWRYNHVLIVQRMLGSKAGTGGSSGYQYLRSTISDRYKVFLDLFNMSNFLVPRDRIPPLTSDMKMRLCS